MSLVEIVTAHLKEPEYLHVILNPLPVYGLSLGILALGIAILSRSRAAQVTALVLVFISAASAWPVKKFGEQAYDNIESKSDDAGYAWLGRPRATGHAIHLRFLYRGGGSRGGAPGSVEVPQDFDPALVRHRSGKPCRPRFRAAGFPMREARSGTRSSGSGSHPRNWAITRD